MASIDLFHHNNFQQFELFAKWIGYFLTAQAQATHSHSLDYKLECLCVQINHAQLSRPINSVKASVLGCDKCWNIT